MRIVIVDESPARAAVIEEGLRDAGLTDITLFIERRGIAAQLERLSPDVYCGVGCGVVATSSRDHTATIAADPDHPANRGKLCSKGTHLGETIGLEGRLLHPMIGSQEAGGTSRWTSSPAASPRPSRSMAQTA